MVAGSGLGLLARGAKDEALHEELRKQVQVAAIHQTTGNHILLGYGAWLVILEVDVAHDTDGGTDNHLGNLGDGDHRGRQPLRPGLDGAQEVVAIHDGMDRVVHGDEVQASG